MNEVRDLFCEHQGTKLNGKIALPSDPGPHPTVMLMYSAMGLTEFVVDRITRLAEQGYIAIATDMYGGGIGFNSTEREAVGPYFSQFLNDPQLLRSRVVHWFDFIKALPEVDPSRISAVGYCFGGRCVLELARSGAEAKSVVSFHGLLSTESPAKVNKIKAKVAVYTGGKDPYAPIEQVDAFREEMNIANADYQITLFSDAYHSFTDPEANEPESSGMQFDPLAEQLSWNGMLVLLKATMG